MKKFLVFIIALGLGLTISFAENDKAGESAAPTTNLSGQVIDVATGETLAGVMVKLEGTDKSVFSDFDGNFTFENLKPAKYDVSVSLISYENVKTEIDLKNPDQGQLDIKLKTIK